MAEDWLGGVPCFGEYRVLRKIGCGGFGCVYLCQHPRLEGRQVAIKTFVGNVESAKARERFLREVRALETLEHPHIIRLIDVGVQEHSYAKNIPYLVMEYAAKGSLRELLEARERPLSFEEALPILSQIGQALQYAHEHRVIHRDVKPENILFNSHEQALLADFGIAVVISSSATKPGDIAGTALYMAPEQFQGESHRQSDQYALACVAYEMLSGRPPFVADEKSALMYHHLQSSPPSPSRFVPDIPRYVDQALLKAMAKKHTYRHKNVAAFLSALEAPQLSISPNRSESLNDFFLEEDEISFHNLIPPRPREVHHVDRIIRLDRVYERHPMPQQLSRAIPAGWEPPRPVRDASPPAQMQRPAHVGLPKSQRQVKQGRFQPDWEILFASSLGLVIFVVGMIGLLSLNPANPSSRMFVTIGALGLIGIIILSFFLGLRSFLRGERTWGGIFTFAGVTSLVLPAFALGLLPIMPFCCVFLMWIYSLSRPKQRTMPGRPIWREKR